MARPRPNTLTLARFLLDCYEVFGQRPGNTSSHELAQALKAKYEAMSVDSLSAHFGTRDRFEANFPSQPTVLRWVGWIREDLAVFFHGRDPLPQTADHRFRKPNAEDVRLLRSIFEGLFRQLKQLADESCPFILSASHMVTHSLLPRIELNKLLGTQFLLRVEPFSQVAVRDALLARECDVAIGWALGLEQSNDALATQRETASALAPNLGISTEKAGKPKKEDDAIFERTLAGSECELRVLFHPAYNTAGEPHLFWKRREYLRAHKESDPTGANFALTSDDLKGAVVMYPNVPHVTRFARYLKEECGAQVSQQDHFVTIVNSVRVNTGLGLYPGYPWLIREIEHEHRVLSARLELPTGSRFNPNLVLRAYTRRKDDSPITAEVTKKADEVVLAIERMLLNEGYPATIQPPSWEVAGPAQPTADLFEAGKSLYLWCVTGGRNLVLFPQWVEWRIDFQTPTTEDEADGKLYRAADPSEPKMDVWVDSKSDLNEQLILRFKRIRPEEHFAEHTIAYCAARLRKRTDVRLCDVDPTPFEGVCLLGSLNFAVENRPFCSPFILSDRRLTEKDCSNIAHSQLMDFLPGTIAIRSDFTSDTLGEGS